MRGRADASLAVLSLCMLGLVLGMPSVSLAAQETATPRERIADYLLFYYVGDPNNAHEAYRPQLLDPEALLRGAETSDFWYDRDIPNLRQLVRDLLQAPRDGSTRRFQRMVADLLDVRGRRVAVYLIDDAGQPLRDDGAVAKRRYGASVDASGRHIWPSANDDPVLGPSGSHLGGSFATGEPNLDSGEKARLTFLHELAHVQIRSDVRPHLFEVAGTDFSYGIDGDHSAQELLPDMSLAYDEGVAGAIELLYAPRHAADAFAALHPDSFVVVETARPDPARHGSSGVSPDVWLYDRLRDEGVKVYQTRTPDLAAFRIGDLPPDVLLHNERLIAVVLSESVRRASSYGGFMRALRRTNAYVEDQQGTIDLGVSRLTVRELASLLVEIGRGILAGDDPTVALVSGGPAAHLLPLALVDYATGRAATSREAFADLFGGQVDPLWLESYWEGGRPRLDDALGEPGAQDRRHAIADLDAIGIAFGLTSNVQDL